jgi:predicted dehydrogenase
MRHMTFILRMKELIDAGAIGKVKSVWCRHFVGNGGDYYFKDWHAERQYSTGLLLQKGAHDIDIIHWLAGGSARRVHGLGALAVYGENVERGAPLFPPRGRAHVEPDLNVWPPSTLAPLNAVVDVEDLSMMQMQLDNGVLASYQQCHFTPDYWRNYCVIGDQGRLENFGNGEEGTCIKVWNKRKAGWSAPDAVHMISTASLEGHGGSDERIIGEFLRFVREGGPTMTSPLAARQSVAAGCAATYSLRHGGVSVEVPPVDAKVAAYFNNDQERAVSAPEANGLWPQAECELALNGSATH